MEHQIAKRRDLIVPDLPDWTIPKPDDHRYINAFIFYLLSVVATLFLFEVVPINLAHTNVPHSRYRITQATFVSLFSLFFLIRCGFIVHSKLKANKKVVVTDSTQL